MELFFELLLAAFAVFGVWCAMRLAIEGWCSSPSVTLAVELSDEQTVENLGALLEEARANLSCRRGSRIVVLYPYAWTEQGALPPEIGRTCRQYGARCYIVDGAADVDETTR